MNLSITSSAPKATPTVEPRTSLSLPPQSGNIKKADRNPPHRKISSEIGAMNTPQKLSNSYGLLFNFILTLFNLTLFTFLTLFYFYFYFFNSGFYG